jgi:hypothetical protein
MDAKGFNCQYEDLLVEPLRNVGFRTHGQSLSYTTDQTVLALIRFQTKFSALAQETHFLLCVRHVFLRTLEREPAKKFLTNPSEYPFKLPVSNLSESLLLDWRYEPINLGPRKYDTIRFGQMSDASEILLDMTHRITRRGLAWMEHLAPPTALEQVKKFGENAYCEKIWIEDYEAFLHGRALDPLSGAS